MHKKVQIVIIHKETTPGEVLLLKTNQKRGGFWQNVTGSLEEGEEYQEAAKRELYEETGLKANNIIALSNTICFRDRFEMEVTEKCFLALFDKQPTHIQISDEHEKYSWIKIDKINKNHYGHESSYLTFMEALGLLKENDD